MIGRLIEFIEAPENFQVLQQENGFCDIDIKCKITEDANDDTEQDLPFAFNKVFARVINEENGAAVTEKFYFKGTEEKCSAHIKNVPIGGPYMLEVAYLDEADSVLFPIRGDKRRHFFVGDVYIIAGQSNAAGMGKGFQTEKTELGIQVLRNLEYWDIASSPFNDLDYAKQSMFMSFGKRIKTESGMPIGFIPAAIGGASVSRWISEENGDLYKKLMNTIIKHKIKARAVLWYQGCAEAGDAVKTEEYISRFERFVQNIRTDLDCPNMKIFTFQLNKMKSKNPNEELDNGYSYVREAQRMAAKRISNVFVLPAIDAANMSDFIHGSKSSNIMLGERLALQVLEKEYKIGMGVDAPEISSASFENKTTVKLEFENVKSYLYSFNATKETLPLKIEDEAGTVKISDYSINGNKITISTNRECIGNAYVSGQWGANPKEYIIDFETQIPMLCFNHFYINAIN